MVNKNENILSHDLSVALKIIGDFGFWLNKESVILDFGCGYGRYVKELSIILPENRTTG